MIRTNLALVTCFCTALCCLTTACSKNRLDIAVEGPWILYQDKSFDDHGKQISVLIAISPGGVGAEALDPKDKMHHHRPQITGGDGYYLPDPGIYCLTFDDTCARPGPTSLDHDGYAATKPLPVNFHAEGGKTIWDLVRINTVNNGVTLILPMPDSYSNEGVWHARFGSSFSNDGKSYDKGREVSIGLLLHYSRGPSTFNLLKCNNPATVYNCSNPPTDINHTKLTNTGNLQILMRAPDNEDPCDMHVRYAYKLSMALLDPAINPSIAVVDPALYVDSDESVHYDEAKEHPCLGKDPQGLHPGGSDTDDRQGIEGGTAARNSNNIVLNTLLTCIINDINSLHLDTHENILDPAMTAQKMSQGLDPHFPRVSQLTAIGALADISLKNLRQAEGLDAKEQAEAHTTVDPTLTRLIDNLKSVVDGSGTKNGSDCRAPIMVANASQ